MKKDDVRVRKESIYKDAVALVKKNSFDDIEKYVNNLIIDYVETRINVEELEERMSALEKAMQSTMSVEDMIMTGLSYIIEISADAIYYTTMPGYNPNDPNSFQKNIETYYSEIKRK